MSFPIDPSKSAHENLLALVNHANSSDLTLTDVDVANIKALENAVEGSRNTSASLLPKPEGRFNVAAGGVTVNYRRLSFAELILNPVEIKAQRTTTLTEIHQAICNAYGLIQDGVVTDGVLPGPGTILPGETFEVTINPSELGGVVYFPKPQTITITWDGVWLEALLTNTSLDGFVKPEPPYLFSMTASQGDKPTFDMVSSDLTKREAMEYVSFLESTNFPGYPKQVFMSYPYFNRVFIDGFTPEIVAAMNKEFWIEASVEWRYSNEPAGSTLFNMGGTTCGITRGAPYGDSMLWVSNKNLTKPWPNGGWGLNARQHYAFGLKNGVVKCYLDGEVVNSYTIPEGEKAFLSGGTMLLFNGAATGAGANSPIACAGMRASLTCPVDGEYVAPKDTIFYEG